MYSNNILNFQESNTILNAYTKKSGNLLNAPRISRKEGGRGHTSIEYSVDASIRRLEDFTEKNERGLITAVRNDTDNNSMGVLND